jgi:hypothetical protein
MPAQPSTAGSGSPLRTRVSSGCAAKQEKPEAKQQSRPSRPRRDTAAPGFPGTGTRARGSIPTRRQRSTSSSAKAGVRGCSHMTRLSWPGQSLGRGEQRCRDAFDDAAAESCWARIQTELLDTRKWTNRGRALAAVHGWVEAFYNRRRHSALNMLVTSTDVGCRPPR